ncbi:MAG: hypothetical protein AAF664_19380 [Planctomycetota bacterium]
MNSSVRSITPKRLTTLVRWFALGTMSAFGAALMPRKWMVETTEFLGLEFPGGEIPVYLARHLSLLYGFVGVLFWWIAADIKPRSILLRPLAWMAIAFGSMQIVVDAMAALPWWWTLGESLSTVFGGCFLLWLVPKNFGTAKK